jgi:hypothetical protein
LIQKNCPSEIKERERLSRQTKVKGVHLTKKNLPALQKIVKGAL